MAGFLRIRWPEWTGTGGRNPAEQPADITGIGTPKGDREKIYLVCYPALGKKETSCKEIRVSSTKLKF
jgi:hypothetical protein